MKSLKILHLSDIHVGGNETLLRDLPYKIGQDINDNKHRFSNEISTILVTGDIFDGKSPFNDDLINRAITFFDNLIEVINGNFQNKIDRENFIFVPGNHDVIRRDENKFEKYETFLKKFYAEEYYKDNYDDNQTTLKIYDDYKIIIVGFNSVNIEKNKNNDSHKQWIKSEVLNKVYIPEKEIDELVSSIISKTHPLQEEWDDYGEIYLGQIHKIFAKLKKLRNNYKEYTIVGALHHHFYPFPETFSKNGDKSIIRNYADIISQFQSNNIKIVLHGHKHSPIQRMITDNKYFEDAKNGIFVFSAGSIGKSDITNKSFQIIEIHPKKDSVKANVYNFRYNGSQFEGVDSICVPPKQDNEKTNSILLLEEFENRNNSNYRKYQENIRDTDNISSGFNLDNIVKFIGNCITKFDKTKEIINDKPEIYYLILLITHYRIIILDKNRNGKNDYHESILESIKKELIEILNDDYVDKIVPFLNSNLMVESVEKYNEMINENKYEQKIYSGFITITQFLTDLYLALSKYGDFFYNDEKIKNKINIKMSKNFIHSKIPLNTIVLSADIDRRTTVVEFKSYDPTAHKVSVLIVRYFEEKLNYFEETIKDIGVKLYYLVPKVTKEGYDLENQNFEAYIPKLLPLLIGDNLYKEKFVFIRELIQNSMDAILLRKGIEKKDINDNFIIIEFGKESVKDIKDTERSSPKSFIKISDNGIGMDTYKIERYLTSIGRSFYTSEEFDELQKEKGITYNPISNFGIGFLSVFLVADEVKIKTRYFEDSKNKTDNYGIEVLIPNYEGCFFIKKLEKNEFKQGTEITLYLKKRKRENGK